eukprot:SAG31_NODE_295_length_18239_cov_15.063065_17_plen_88_part_00
MAVAQPRASSRVRIVASRGGALGCPDLLRSTVRYDRVPTDGALQLYAAERSVRRSPRYGRSAAVLRPVPGVPAVRGYSCIHSGNTGT